MPYVTPMQVMEAVFSKQQISAIMTMRRNDYSVRSYLNDREHRDLEAKSWAAFAIPIQEAIGKIEHYRDRAEAKCLKSDDKWRGRLVKTQFWQQQEANAQYTNRLMHRVQGEIEAAASALEMKADDEKNDGIRWFALKLRGIELPRDDMPPREYEPVEFSFLDDAKR